MDQPFRVLAETMNEGVVTLAADGRILYCNRRFARRLGIPLEPILGAAMARFVIPQDRARLADLIGQAQSGTATGEVTLQAPDGTRIPAQLSLSALMLGAMPGICLVVTDLTEQKRQAEMISTRQRIEESLRASEERFRNLFEHAPLGIAITDWEGRLQQCNPAYCAMLGCTSEELEGRVFSELVHPDDRAANLAEIHRLQAEEVPSFEIENRYVHKDGQPVWVHKFVSVLRDDTGAPVHLMALITDVTERRRAEVALRAHEEHLRLAMAVGHMGSWDWNVLTGRVEWSTGHFELLGWHPDEVEPSYEAWAKRVHPEDWERIETLLRTTMAAHQDYLADFRVVWPDGSLHWLAARGRYHYDAEGRCTRMVGVMIDITDLKRAEEELRLSRDRLRFVLNATGIGLWLNTMPLNNLVWDDRTRELFFVPPGAEPTIDLFWSRLHPDDREPTRLAVEAAVRDHTRYAIDHRAINPDTGEVRWIRSMGQVTYGPDGTPVRFDGINYDITDRKQAEEALREADRRKDEFLAMLAHELRNPLAPIRTAVQILNRLGPIDPKQQWARDVIARQVKHLARLVDDLLDSARLIRGQITLQPEPVELATILQQAVEAAQPLFEARQHQFHLTRPNSPVWLEGDPVRLMQVLLNLLDNAAKYTEPGGRIDLEAEVLGAEVAVRVRDTGPGLSPALLSRAFELFEQGERTLDRAQGGLGIGLTLVRRLVELHGGRVEAHSAGPGQGAEFTVWLPIRATD